jgi:hypothetical protein
LQLRSRMGGRKERRPGKTPAGGGRTNASGAQRCFCATAPRPVRLKSNSCQDRPRLFRAGHGESVGSKPGNFTARSFAQINGCRKQCLACGRRIEVELIASRSAPKALIYVLLEVGGKTASFRGRGAMHGTRAADFLFRSLARNKPQQGENLCHADARPDLCKSNAGHRRTRNTQLHLQGISQQRRGARNAAGWTASSISDQKMSRRRR